jgi:hypothetical protein
MKRRMKYAFLIIFASNGFLFAQSTGVLWVTSDITVQFIVTDPLGRRTGNDPRGSNNPWIGVPLDEIPNANYGNSGLGDSPVDTTSEVSDNWHEFDDQIQSPEGDGIYKIDCIGLELTKFLLGIHLASNDTTQMQEFTTQFTGLIDSNEVVSYQIDYHGQPGSSITFQKVVTQQVLHQDLDNSFKLGLVGNSAFYTILSDSLNQFDQSLAAKDSIAARSTLQNFLNQITQAPRDSAGTNFVTSDAFNILQSDVNTFLQQLPPGFTVKLTNSTGANLTGGSLQYYESASGGWKDATNNNDGTFSITTQSKTLSLRMTYAYGSQQKDNVTVGNDTVVFQTVNTQVKLEDSHGNPLDTGSVQYYAGAWRAFGTTVNGAASFELLPNNYSFRMTYGYGSNDKQQDIGSNPIVVFSTVNATIQLKNSQGNLMDQGTAQYYAGAWRTFGSPNGGAGTTVNGIVTKELLPNSYSFRMTYAYASNDKQQDIGTNPVVVFQTVNTEVKLQDSHNNPLDTGSVQYYAGAWRTFGITSGGVASLELLPNSYSFRMTYAFVSSDKTQDIGANNIVQYSTVLATVQVTDQQNNPVNGATVTYYSGAWRNFGATAVNGQATLELLPVSLQFRATLSSKQQNVTQDISTNPLVKIQFP